MPTSDHTYARFAFFLNQFRFFLSLSPQRVLPDTHINYQILLTRKVGQLLSTYLLSMYYYIIWLYQYSTIDTKFKKGIIQFYIAFHFQHCLALSYFHTKISILAHRKQKKMTAILLYNTIKVRISNSEIKSFHYIIS